MIGVLAYCRAGFENDLATELQEKAASVNIYGYAKTKRQSGFVVFHCYQPEDSQVLVEKIRLSDLIFARQWFILQAELKDLPTDDRITSILGALIEVPQCGELRVEYPDTTEGRELSKFCRKFSVPLRQALRGKSLLTPKEQSSKPIAMAFFTSSHCGYFGYIPRQNASPHPLGILRLKFPSQAPSRSTLKLDEAIQLFLSKEEQQQRIVAGMHAVDLGACPGGWTYQLVHRGLFVQSVDNGAMDDQLMETGQVQYFAEDGFKYEPKKKNVTWLVCDMIEQPKRVAQLMAKWLVKGWCKETIFNLKLPMKRRFECVQESIEDLTEILSSHGYHNAHIAMKHLYHNREEVTVYVRLNP